MWVSQALLLHAGAWTTHTLSILKSLPFFDIIIILNPYNDNITTSQSIAVIFWVLIRFITFTIVEKVTYDNVVGKCRRWAPRSHMVPSVGKIAYCTFEEGGIVRSKTCKFSRI